MIRTYTSQRIDGCLVKCHDNKYTLVKDDKHPNGAASSVPAAAAAAAEAKKNWSNNGRFCSIPTRKNTYTGLSHQTVQLLNSHSDVGSNEETGCRKQSCIDDNGSKEPNARIRSVAAALKTEHAHQLQDLEQEVQELLRLSQSRLDGKIDNISRRREQVRTDITRVLDSARKDCGSPRAAEETNTASSSFTQSLREKALETIKSYSSMNSHRPATNTSSVDAKKFASVETNSARRPKTVGSTSLPNRVDLGRNELLAEGKAEYGDDDDEGQEMKHK